MLMDNSNYVPVAQGKKEGGKILIIAIIALLVGAAAATAIIVSINGGFNFGKKEETTSKEKKAEDKVADGDITDDKTIIELSYKANFVLSHGYDAVAAKEMTTSEFKYYGLKDYAGLTASQKIGSVVRSFMDDETVMTKDQWAKVSDKERNTLAKRYSSESVEDFYVGLNVIDNVDRIKERYQYIYGSYGESIPAEADGVSIVCGNYNYLSSINVFATVNGCGDLGAHEIKIEQYKYEQSGNLAYVYFVAGVTVPNANGDGKEEYYGDLDKATKVSYNGYVSVNNTSVKYTRYRVVFEQEDDGNYIYKTVEKVN